MLSRRKPHERDRLTGLFTRDVGIFVAQECAGHDIGQHGHRAERLGDLKGAGEAMRADVMRPQAGDVPAERRDRTRVRPVEAGHQIEAGRLAGAVGPDQRDGFVVLDREADVLNGAKSAEPLAHVPDDEHISHRRRSLCLHGLATGEAPPGLGHHAHQSGRLPQDHSHQDQAVDGQLDAADRTAEPALQQGRCRFQQHRSDHRAPQRSDPADDGDQRRLDRDAEAEGRRGVDEVDVLGVECAGERGEKCADQVDVAFDAWRIDSDRFGCVFILADGDKVISHP